MVLLWNPRRPRQMGQIQFDESQQTGPPIRDGHVARVQDNARPREVVPHLHQAHLASNYLNLL